MLIAAWSNFLGANTQQNAKRLQEGVGVNAVNLRLGFGDMRGWRDASVVVTTGGATALISAYRMNRSAASDTAAWMQWTVDVDVVHSLIANDTTEEIYFTGDGVPKRTDNVLGLPAAPGPAAARTLGIPKPTAALTATILSAGTGDDETRVYVDTFVNDQGRESAPGLPRSIVCKPDTTITLNAFDAAPGGYPDLALRRIYVSVDGSEYQRCAEVSSSATTTTDTGVRGSILQTGGATSKPAHEMPPSDLKGLIELWNGMLGGFRGKQFCASEPNKPWAWPVEYQDTVFDDIVATGKWLQNWVLLTTSTPVVLRGGPLLFDRQPVPFNQACAAKRSVVSMGTGVCWASPNGLCFLGEGGARILTEGILSPEQWQALTPSNIVGARFERYYLGFFPSGTPGGFLIDPANPSGIVFLTQTARGAYYDPISDRLYLQDSGNVIRRWNAPAGTALSATFKTEVKRHPQPVNPGYAMLVAAQPVSVGFTLYALLLQSDGTMAWATILTRTVITGEPFSLPSGYLAQEFQVQIVSTGPIEGVLLAEDVGDLV